MHFHNTMVRAVIPEYYRLGDFKKQDIFLKFWRLRSEIQVPTGLVSNVLSWWLEGGCFLCMSSHGLFFAWRKRSVMSFLLSIRMASISGQGPTLSLNIGTLPVSVLLCPTLATPWTVARQAPLSMEFSRQEYWSSLPFPSPGYLHNPGIKPKSPALQADS